MSPLFILVRTALTKYAKNLSIDSAVVPKARAGLN